MAQTIANSGPRESQ